ncbi:MAG: glutaminyl-peptide cyclotransferase [Chloroflexota bacterium]|nr:glutaminyl-peptide cyclotransferase [Chloroflexota bacterium]
MRRVLLLLIVLVISLLLVGQSAAQTCPCPSEPPVVEQLTPEIITSFPHDTGSFTQGLLLHDGTFYESAGEYGESDVRQVEIETGEILRMVALDAQYFAEGLTLVDNLVASDGTVVPPYLIQLTWRENTAFVWNLETFEIIGSFLYETDGWGICYDGERLYMSDGSDNLFVRDPRSFRLLAMIPVRMDGQPVFNLNELECVGSDVYANVWQTNNIVRIDKATGYVNANIDASFLLTDEEYAALEGGAVLNGIAYNAAADTFYITGKLWPRVFEVRFVGAAG